MKSERAPINIPACLGQAPNIHKPTYVRGSYIPHTVNIPRYLKSINELAWWMEEGGCAALFITDYSNFFTQVHTTW